ncbi:alpha/beta hydrolase [Streptantibioticus parmotrematis]|uniref:alpha/beta fold hydrolase n=1 Tax=Streptantibioticus parmotrematis TaxID=2873249 RepID=UPI0033EC2345
MSIDTTTAHAPVPRPARSPDRPADVVEEHRLSFDGFRFVARVVRRADTSGERGAGSRVGGGDGDSRGAAVAPLVVFGGSSQDRMSWARHERWLTPLCPVVTVDLPGYGEADPLPTRYGMDFLAAAARHMLHELDMPRVNLLGACFGGAIALRFAQHYPDTLERLLLAGMTPYVPEEYARAVPLWLRMLDDERHADMADQLVGRFMSNPGAGDIRRHAAISRLIHRQFMEQTPRQIQMAVVDHNTRLLNHEWYRPERVAAVPTLVFTGEHDALTTPAMGRALAERLPGAVFTTVRSADHLVHMERIEEFADLIARFVTDRPLDGLAYLNAVEIPRPSPCG